jgi:phage gp36-like protein
MTVAPYITDGELEDRLGADVMVAVFDVDNDGVADADPVARLIADATSKVAGYLRATLTLSDLDPGTQNEIKRLTLDVAVAMAAQRRPHHVRVDWIELMKAAERDLVNLRKGLTMLDAATPVPANHGGTVTRGVDDAGEENPRYFADGTGDF